MASGREETTTTSASNTRMLEADRGASGMASRRDKNRKTVAPYNRT